MTTEARRWATAEFVAWNALDLDRIIARYADDVTLYSPAVVTRMDRPDGLLRGKAEVRAYFAIGSRPVMAIRTGVRRDRNGIRLDGSGRTCVCDPGRRECLEGCENHRERGASGVLVRSSRQLSMPTGRSRTRMPVPGRRTARA